MNIYSFKRLPWLVVPLALLSGCGSDSDSRSDSDRFEQFLADNQGVYQSAVTVDGQAQRLRLSIHQAATLTLLDDRDNASHFDGERDGDGVSFSNQVTCEPTDSAFECQFDFGSVNLALQSVDTTLELADLVGTFRIASAGEVGQIVVDGGNFEASFINCDISGAIALDNGLLSVRESSNSCDAAPSTGIAFAESLYTQNDTLDVAIPNSRLSGFWIP